MLIVLYHGFQLQILQYNSLNSKKKRVDEMTQEMRRTCKKGNTDDRDPFFSRACADNEPNYGWKHGELKIPSERFPLQPISLMVLLHSSFLFDVLIVLNTLF